MMKIVQLSAVIVRHHFLIKKSNNLHAMVATGLTLLPRLTHLTKGTVTLGKVI